MNTPTILLLDNGSRRPASTLKLRQLAQSLGKATGQTVHPVSLQHANHIDAEQLDGLAANTFEPFLRERLQSGQKEFLVLPLFFGKSRALTSFIPETVARLEAEFGSFELVQANELCPPPGGEPRLTQILYDNIMTVIQANALNNARIVLVDHGSPITAVTAAREWLASSLQKILGPQVKLHEAVMERREGSKYDFNGRLLEEVLSELSRQESTDPVVLSMLFISPGRHAGTGGDIESICHQVISSQPRFKCFITPLVGEHPAIIDILQQRLEEIS
jgi:sirohydrochlorin ferrochelatase